MVQMPTMLPPCNTPSAIILLTAVAVTLSKLLVSVLLLTFKYSGRDLTSPRRLQRSNTDPRRR